MSADEQIPAVAVQTSDAVTEKERSEKILKAKELYSHGSRNFLVKSYAEAADELSQVCALYEELYGELSDEIGMPYLLYAKSLIALALDENKVIDVPDEEDDDDDDDDEEDDEMGAAENGAKAAAASSSSSATTNGKLAPIDEKAATTTASSTNEVDSTESSESGEVKVAADSAPKEKASEEAQVSSTNDAAAGPAAAAAEAEAEPAAASSSSSSSAGGAPVMDGEKPSTSNGADAADEEDDENEAASSLQLAWEILELAAKVFVRQGASGLPNLAEVQTELANIEFENNILDSAREDYEKALAIYKQLPTNYRRAMAEIHYKIGLTYLMQQLNTEGAESLKAACKLIESEIEEINKNAELSEKDKNNIQDMEETKQEIWAKIAEIEETQAQNVAEVRAALDSYIKPIASENGAASSSSSAAADTPNGAVITSSSKPTDITHLIKRKKTDDAGSEAEAASSPAKRPAL